MIGERLLGEEDEDPVLSLVNLVDVFLVVIAALLLAMPYLLAALVRSPRPEHLPAFLDVVADDGNGMDAATLARIRALAIPPAWTDVFGRKLKAGRKQSVH